MAYLQKYKCRNCGHDFETTVLTADEVQDRKWRHEPVGSVRCPNCKRGDLNRV